MRNPKNHPKTSQATPRDFKKTYSFVASHHESIISIQISQKVSGTYASASNAAKTIKNKNIYILDSCNVSVGQGLLAMYAVDLKSQGKSYKEIISRNLAEITLKTYKQLSQNNVGKKAANATGRSP